MKKLLIIVALFWSLYGNSQVKIYNKDGVLNTSIDTLHGFFNGTFLKFHRNGKKAIQGTFKDNQKIGKWIFYDTLGKPIIKRVYTNSYQFEDKSIPRAEIYPLHRNANNLIEYPQVATKDILSGENVFHYIEKNKYNDLLFKNDILWKIITKYVADSTKLEIYKNSEFIKQMSPTEITAKLNKYKFELIGYKTKEYLYFSTKTKMTESRILGICPVVYLPEFKIYVDMFWIYYPTIRPLLANEKVNFNNEIITLEDVFHFRHFNSILYLSENYYENTESTIDIFKNQKEISNKSIELESKNLYFELKCLLYVQQQKVN